MASHLDLDLGEDLHMASKHISSTGHAKNGDAVTGKSVAQLGDNFVLVQVGTKKRPAAKPFEKAGVLIPKAGQALKKPGLARGAVFTGSKRVFAYSVDPADPSRLIREAADGTRKIGRMVDGKFKVVA